MEQSKIAHLNPDEYTHLPHAQQDFEAHEQSDVSIRGLVVTLITIVVVIAITAIGMWGLFQLLKYMANKAPENQKYSTVETIGFRHGPDGYPELQGIPTQGGNPNSPAKDTDAMRKNNAAILAGQKGMRPGFQPGLPIEEAMNEALAKKLFKTAAAPPAAKPERK